MTTWTGFKPGEQWIPTAGTTAGQWVTTNLPTVAFTGTQYGYLHTWSQWQPYTWGYIQSSGLLWEELGGFTFITPAQTNVTNWSSSAGFVVDESGKFVKDEFGNLVLWT